MKDETEEKAKQLVQKWESEQHFLELTPAQFIRLENYVAAALREAQGEISQIAKLRARIAEQDSQIDRADEHTAKIMKALEVAEAERDAEFARGLERAMETIRPMVSHKVTDAIQAELNKAGK